MFDVRPAARLVEVRRRADTAVGRGQAGAVSIRMSPARLSGVRTERLATGRFKTAEMRNVEIVRRYEAGASLASIGADLGYTRERVRQIVKLSGASMPRDYKCAVVGCEIAPRSLRSYCYTHRVRVERYGNPLGSRSAVPRGQEQHGTYAAYRRGCRCEHCRRASADLRREYLHRVHPDWRYMPDKAPGR
jgi:Sigma-70, region 4